MFFIHRQRSLLGPFISRTTRGYATYASGDYVPAVLHLKSGQSFKGRSFGAQKSIFGETVFSTSITSCEYFSNQVEVARSEESPRS